MSTRPLVHLIDAHFQIFRAYHALPDLRAPDGAPIGAVRGYAQTLIKFLRTHEPTHVAAAFDFALTSFRNRLFPDYKLGRTEAPADLEPQFATCAEVTRGLGIPLFAMEDFEADDVIATLVGRLVAQGADVAIVTRDKDLGALVSDRVWLYDLGRDERSGPKEIEARLGVPPAQVGDYLALVGDAVDHIPGVRGIGPATARELLARFGSIDSIPLDWAAWSDLNIRAARRAFDCLDAARDQLALSRELVRLRDELDLDARLEDLRYRGAERERLRALLERLGLEGLLARVPRFRN
jgi:DNA polymerase-1